MIEVTSEPERKRVRLIVAGWLTADEIDSFTCEYGHAASRIPRTDDYDLLIEVRGGVQSQDIVAALREAARSAPRRARRVAVVSNGQLLAMQLKRIAGDGRDLAFFQDIHSAEAWLERGPSA